MPDSDCLLSRNAVVGTWLPAGYVSSRTPRAFSSMSSTAAMWQCEALQPPQRAIAGGLSYVASFSSSGAESLQSRVPRDRITADSKKAAHRERYVMPNHASTRVPKLCSYASGTTSELSGLPEALLREILAFVSTLRHIDSSSMTFLSG